MLGSRHGIAEPRQRVRSLSSGMCPYTGPSTYYSDVAADDESGVIADRPILLIDHESMDWSRPVESATILNRMDYGPRSGS
jgi:hypothetical protein